MATVENLLQMIARKEVIIFDLNETIATCKKDNERLSAKLAEIEKKVKPKGNGKDADKPTTV